MVPPSASTSLLLEDTDEAGEARREGNGEVVVPSEITVAVGNFGLIVVSWAALERLSLLPLPNLLQT